MQKVGKPLPMVAAQNRHSAFTASGRAATIGSGAFLTNTAALPGDPVFL